MLHTVFGWHQPDPPGLLLKAQREVRVTLQAFAVNLDMYFSHIKKLGGCGGNPPRQVTKLQKALSYLLFANYTSLLATRWLQVLQNFHMTFSQTERDRRRQISFHSVTGFSLHSVAAFSRKNVQKPRADYFSYLTESPDLELGHLTGFTGKTEQASCNWFRPVAHCYLDKTGALLTRKVKAWVSESSLLSCPTS